MAMTEDPAERKSFEHLRHTVFSGRAMKVVVFGLEHFSRVNPPQGRLAKMLAIYANEVAKADAYTQLLIDTYAKKGMKLPAKPKR